jgi:hypothetical protein
VALHIPVTVALHIPVVDIPGMLQADTPHKEPVPVDIADTQAAVHNLAVAPRKPAALAPALFSLSQKKTTTIVYAKEQRQSALPLQIPRQDRDADDNDAVDRRMAWAVQDGNQGHDGEVDRGGGKQDRGGREDRGGALGK